MLSTHFIEENKWHVMRHGLDAEILDFVLGRRLTMRQSLDETLDFVDDVLDDLGSRREINNIRILLDDPHGTGADRQIATYRRTGNIRDVIELLTQQTMKDIPQAEEKSLL